MKRIWFVVVMFTSLIVSTPALHTQTATETAAWLQTRLRLYSVKPDLALDTIVRENLITTYHTADQTGDGPWVASSWETISSRDIADVVSRYVQSKTERNRSTEEGYLITVAGPTRISGRAESNQGRYLTFELAPNTAKEDEIE